jgi:hypothetical protein
MSAALTAGLMTTRTLPVSLPMCNDFVAISTKQLKALGFLPCSKEYSPLTVTSSLLITAAVLVVNMQGSRVVATDCAVFVMPATVWVHTMNLYLSFLISIATKKHVDLSAQALSWRKVCW